MERFGIIMGVSREAVVMMMVRRWWRELEWGRRRGRVSATAKPGRRWGAAAEIEEWQSGGLLKYRQSSLCLHCSSPSSSR